MSERPLRPTWLRLALLSVLGAILSAYAWWPMIANYPRTPEEDGRYVYHQFEIAKASLRTYGEVSLWNPFDCRGIPMWDYPESMTSSPILFLTAHWDTMVTLIAWNWIHLIMGFVGMWLLVRDELKLSRIAALTGAAMFSLAVCHTSQYAGEHETFVTFLVAPLMILFWRRAEQNISYAVGLGILLAFMLYNGATYPLPFAGFMLVLETFTRMRSQARLKNIGIAAMYTGLTAFLLGAARLLPLVIQLQSHKRALEGESDFLKPLSVWLMYTLRSSAWRATFNGQNYVFGEYDTYIGYFGVALALVGFVLAVTEAPWMAFLGAALFVLMLGHFSAWAPWHLMHAHMFPFKSMRVPSRFRLLEMMCISAFVAIAIDRLPARLKKLGASVRVTHAVRIATIGLALLAVGDAVGLGLELHGFRWNGPVPAKVTPSTRFYYGGADLSRDFADQPRQNHAWLGCRAYEWAFRADAPLWVGDVPQAKSADVGAVVEVANRTHNTFSIEVEAARPTRILLNSAYDPGWRSDVGVVVENADKLLAIDVPAGHHRMFVRYRPPYLVLGIVLSIVGIFFSIAVLTRRRWRPSLTPEKAAA